MFLNNLRQHKVGGIQVQLQQVSWRMGNGEGFSSNPFPERLALSLLKWSPGPGELSLSAHTGPAGTHTQTVRSSFSACDQSLLHSLLNLPRRSISPREARALTPPAAKWPPCPRSSRTPPTAWWLAPSRPEDTRARRCIFSQLETVGAHPVELRNTSI